MKKQFILSAALASSILYSSSASAVINVKYGENNTNTFSIENNVYNTLHQAGQSILPRLRNNEEVNMDSSSQVRYLNALFGDANVQKDFIAVVNAFESNENQISFDEFTDALKQAKQDLDILGISVDEAASYFDLNDLFNDDDTELSDVEDALNFINSQAQLHTSDQKITSAFSNASSTSEINDLKQSSDVQDNLKKKVENISLGQESDNAKTQSVANNTLKNLQDNISQYVSDTKKASELTPIQTPQTKTTETMQATNNVIRSVIDKRLSGLASGISSGDMIEHYGVWVKGTLSTGQQKTKGLSDGHKFDLAAITIGADIGEDNLIGIAYTYAKANVKSKLNSVNKDEIPMHIGSIYGMVTQDNLFVQGQANYGITTMTKKRDTGDLQGNVVKAKPKGTSIGGAVQVGYDYVIADYNNCHLIPTLGVSYSSNKVNGYTETGTGLKTTVAKREAKRTSGLAGLAYRHNINSEMGAIIPEIHANIDYSFNSKNDSTKVTLVTGLDPIVVGAEKQAKAFYTFGGSVQLLTHGGLEATAGYDLGLAQKYQSHTGTIKVKLNF
jgi:predicted fused transcriptional regulator/phosphomethylpyrimidine kinase